LNCGLSTEFSVHFRFRSASWLSEAKSKSEVTQWHQALLVSNMMNTGADVSLV